MGVGRTMRCCCAEFTVSTWVAVPTASRVGDRRTAVHDVARRRHWKGAVPIPSRAGAPDVPPVIRSPAVVMGLSIAALAAQATPSAAAAEQVST